MHKGSYGGKKNSKMGVATYKATGAKTMGADAYGPQKPLGSVSLAPSVSITAASKKVASPMSTSSSGRKARKGY